MSHGGLQMNRTVQGVAAAIYGIIQKHWDERVRPGKFQGIDEPYTIFDDRRLLTSSTSSSTAPSAANPTPPPQSGNSSVPPPQQSNADSKAASEQTVRTASSIDHASVPLPDFMRIYKHIYALFRRAQVEPECLIAALTYLERFLEKNPNFAITGMNWERLVFAAVMIASKAWDDVSCSSKSFCLCSNGSLTIRELNKMERILLGDLDYSLYITAETYRVVYYDLKKIWVNMIVDEKGCIQPLQAEVVASLNLPANWGQWYIFNCPQPHTVAQLDGGEGIGPLNSPRLTPASFPALPTTVIKITGQAMQPLATATTSVRAYNPDSDAGAGIGASHSSNLPPQLPPSRQSVAPVTAPSLFPAPSAQPVVLSRVPSHAAAPVPTASTAAKVQPSFVSRR